jgi:hypothetical protein
MEDSRMVQGKDPGIGMRKPLGERGGLATARTSLIRIPEHPQRPRDVAETQHAGVESPIGLWRAAVRAIDQPDRLLESMRAVSMAWMVAGMARRSGALVSR